MELGTRHCRKKSSCISRGFNGAVTIGTPLPLVNAKKKYVIVWTPKVASNIVLTWYLRDVGLLYAANFYSDRLHEFRGKVLVNSRYYKKWTEWAWSDVSGSTYVKVMRDPFKRAVSSYRHALRYPETRAVIDRNTEFDISKGFSFVQFLMAIEKVDICNTDIHLRQQHHPVQDIVGAEHVDTILLDALDVDLLEVLDHKLGAEVSEESSESVEEMKARVEANINHYVVSHHADYSGRAFEGKSYADEIFSLDDHKEFPAFEKFVTPETERLVRKIYEADFADMERVVASEKLLKKK